MGVIVRSMLDHVISELLNACVVRAVTDRLISPILALEELIAWLQVRWASKAVRCFFAVVRFDVLILAYRKLDPGLPFPFDLAAEDSLAVFLVIFALDAVRDIVAFKRGGRLTEGDVVLFALADNPGVTKVEFLVALGAGREFAREVLPIVSPLEGCWGDDWRDDRGLFYQNSFSFFFVVFDEEVNIFLIISCSEFI